ncbi:hypothetical protein EYF80_023584 [Liparis tanakae]|uniref:Uncharacterized protein n=1 Tax=Liparis tanakae TaxID=230148 RepID=A0A4Z2HK15_9TELE|nr:hypothetical protein EYF80_023584 [Liparis tanakae]
MVPAVHLPTNGGAFYPITCKGRVSTTTFASSTHGPCATHPSVRLFHWERFIHVDVKVELDIEYERMKCKMD